MRHPVHPLPHLCPYCSRNPHLYTLRRITHSFRILLCISSSSRDVTPSLITDRCPTTHTHTLSLYIVLVPYELRRYPLAPSRFPSMYHIYALPLYLYIVLGLVLDVLAHPSSRAVDPNRKTALASIPVTSKHIEVVVITGQCVSYKGSMQNVQTPPVRR